jgi:hypothetical protein
MSSLGQSKYSLPSLMFDPGDQTQEKGEDIAPVVFRRASSSPLLSIKVRGDNSRQVFLQSSSSLPSPKLDHLFKRRRRERTKGHQSYDTIPLVLSGIW